MNMSELMDIIFIFSSIVFNTSVSALYIAMKLGEMVMVQVCGAIVISLVVPFTITLLGYVKEKAERRVLRRLIRVENKITGSSELKKLDRCLRKAFKKEVKQPNKRELSTEVKPHSKLSEKERKLLEMDAKLYALMEEASVNEDKWTPELGA